ncbi:MAG: DUF2310 family Zn-ribbon-containing protein [Anaerohalosphaera sp.]|nr:DUF2310 family Zn-ribbon-containing protein [Anaerohalosphaera sp.]
MMTTRLEEALFGEFDFKCDKCRLLSNIAREVRYSIYG